MIRTNDKFAKKWGDLGPVYGKQWRSWTTDSEYIDGETYFKYQAIDQIQNLINDLKSNPDSRRLMVNAWNVNDIPDMVLPPCHYGFQVYTRPTTREEKITNPGKYRAISLMWNQRSVDTFLGLPFNIASYGLLLEIIAKEVNMMPDQLIGNLGDTHLYLDHLDQAEEQIRREPYKLPQLKFKTHLDDFESWLFDPNYGMLLRPKDFILDDYESHPTIKAPLSN